MKAVRAIQETDKNFNKRFDQVYLPRNLPGKSEVKEFVLPFCLNTRFVFPSRRHS